MSTPSIFGLKKLRNLEKSREGDADDSSSISDLPDEIILQILNKLIDLKTLCFCYLVSRRFSSIVLQVGAISVTAPLRIPSILDKNTVGDIDGGGFPVISSIYGESVQSANRFLGKFRGVKSLSIKLPSYSHGDTDNPYLFKWKVKFSNKVESFIFLSPSSIFDKDGFCVNGNGNEEENMVLTTDMFLQKSSIGFQCFKDVIMWHRMLLGIIRDLPKLEEVSMTDFQRRGRLFLNGEKLDEIKEWVQLPWETVMNHLDVTYPVSNCYISVLKLPVSGYVMKGIYVALVEMEDHLQGGNDSLMNSEDGFEDKEDAAYTEAVMEVLEKYKDRMHRMRGLV